MYLRKVYPILLLRATIYFLVVYVVVCSYDAMVKMTFSEHFLKFACNFYFFFLIFVTFLLFILFYMCYNNHSVKRTSDKLSSTPNQRRDRGGNCYVDIKS